VAGQHSSLDMPKKEFRALFCRLQHISPGRQHRLASSIVPSATCRKPQGRVSVAHRLDSYHTNLRFAHLITCRPRTCQFGKMNKDLEDASRVPRDAASQLFKAGIRDERFAAISSLKTARVLLANPASNQNPPGRPPTGR